jgi:hypothetical protein
MHDVLERFKQIPPWGYAVIAVGVLVLAFLTKNKSGAAPVVTQSIAPVDPSAETAANDSLNRMNDLYVQLVGTVQNNQDQLHGEIKNLADQAGAAQKAITTQEQFLNDRIDVLYNPTLNTGLKVGSQATTNITHVGAWYTVQKGDTIRNIAERAYGGKNSDITSNWITKDPNNTNLAQNGLKEGQKIWLPTG